jgi:hypothetical protein
MAFSAAETTKSVNILPKREIAGIAIAYSVFQKSISCCLILIDIKVIFF